jgi:predicted DNA-binding protein (MmcQ/YjbR family)
MDLDLICDCCRSMPGVTEDVKWDDDLVFSVGGKMFAVTMLEPPHRLSFKCTPEEYADLIERQGVIPAPYLARAHWVSLEDRSAMDDGELQERLSNSYALVKAKLPKKVREGLDARPARKAARTRRN